MQETIFSLSKNAYKQNEGTVFNNQQEYPENFNIILQNIIIYLNRKTTANKRFYADPTESIRTFIRIKQADETRIHHVNNVCCGNLGLGDQ